MIWHSKIVNQGSAHEQGLIIDEGTGANIAVTYDPRHAALIVRAVTMLPKLVRVLEECRDALKDHVQYEGDEGSLEGDAFRTATSTLSEASNVEVGE